MCPGTQSVTLSQPEGLSYISPLCTHTCIVHTSAWDFLLQVSLAAHFHLVLTENQIISLLTNTPLVLQVWTSAPALHPCASLMCFVNTCAPLVLQVWTSAPAPLPCASSSAPRTQVPVSWCRCGTLQRTAVAALFSCAGLPGSRADSHARSAEPRHAAPPDDGCRAGGEPLILQ